MIGPLWFFREGLRILKKIDHDISVEVKSTVSNEAIRVKFPDEVGGIEFSTSEGFYYYAIGVRRGSKE